MITHSGNIDEVTYEDHHLIIGTRIYSGSSLIVPERWQPKKYRSTMCMPDLFIETDEANLLATMLYRNLRSVAHKMPDIICGTVFISDENNDELIDLTLVEFNKIVRKAMLDMR